MKIISIFISAALLLNAVLPGITYSHRSGCHSLHSCPSDTESYVCGDLGHCSGCPDNRYCKAGKPRTETMKPPEKDIDEADVFYLCSYVIDGDTIIVRIKDRKEKVRLIGVDAPETDGPYTEEEPFGKEAAVFTRKMVQGRHVRLEYDWQRRDRYGRLLAYVYLKDGTFLNAEIIRQGFAAAYTRFPFKYLDDFREYEREARENGNGLWGM